MAYLDPLKVNLTNIFVLLVRDNLNEFMYDASLASLFCEVACTEYGLKVFDTYHCHF
jgi:Middle or third domain of peptidase_M16